VAQRRIDGGVYGAQFAAQQRPPFGVGSGAVVHP
jgi:hypothetical protein